MHDTYYSDDQVNNLRMTRIAECDGPKRHSDPGPNRKCLLGSVFVFERDIDTMIEERGFLSLNGS